MGLALTVVSETWRFSGVARIRVAWCLPLYGSYRWCLYQDGEFYVASGYVELAAYEVRSLDQY